MASCASRARTRDHSLAPGQAEPSAVWRSLTRAQRMYVRDGSIHGDCTMATVRALRSKGLFELVIDSPNGRCGFMRLTSLGGAVRDSALAAADTSHASDKGPGIDPK